ncbi:peptidase G2 autoproteolytic cleavage domain-containing protein [Bacillus swezeyi]|uniref:peptidase G2 autoproteolytic cleavage domain-containing protein n=1 Tax=Bacillus swezeyi TaxID=1925020 RepID=UPI00123B4690|nr:peptidase G2 autoproteolytic cleavage domain-containing protein [Bacillus swezeyi]KAA6476151.1 peptidase G2 [Bacillus swezeyi]
MANNTSFLGLHKPKNLEIDKAIDENFELIDRKIGSALDDGSSTYENLNERLKIYETKFDSLIERNVMDFGAKGDGVTDDTQAFHDAMAGGGYKVVVPKGVFRTSGLHVPSDTMLVGSGKKKTIIKLLDSIPVENSVLTNSDWTNGNENIYIGHLTLDWNKDTRPAGWKIPKGPTSSCLLFANVHYSFVEHVFAKNGGLHGFDSTSPNYNRHGEQDDSTYYQPGGCSFVTFSHCEATGAGDDNFTCHFGFYTTFSHCISYHPMGNHNGTSNSNCFEIDDGSQDVLLDSCVAIGGVRGFEIKAHDYAPAAKRVQLVNCRAHENAIGFCIRHIGHHLADEPTSKTAHDVQLVNCQSVNPKQNDIYKGVGASALVVSGYDSVNIANFQAICEDQSYDYSNDTIVMIYYKGRYTNLKNITIRGFRSAANDLYVLGGENSVGKCLIDGVFLVDGGKTGVAFGASVDNCSVSNVYGHRLGESAGANGLYSSSPDLNISNIDFQGYETTFLVGGKKTPYELFKHKGSAVIASKDSHVTGTNGLVAGSVRGQATGGSQSGVINSYNTINPAANSTVWGWGRGTAASAANRKVEISAQNGTIKASGSITGSQTFTDYGEYFESLTGEQIPTGTLVTLEGERIRPAEKGDHLLGVISDTAGVILGEASFHWSGRYVKNEFGGYVYEWQKGSDGKMAMVPKEHPDYRPEQEYKSRKDREEWNVVGLVGQVYVKCDKKVKAGDFIEADGGIATKTEQPGQCWQVMKITSEYDVHRGFGIALVFIR